MNRIDELRETWGKAYKVLVKDLGNGCTLEDVACMFFELGWRAADESMKVFDKHKKSLEAVRKHYKCDGRKYRCKYYDNCMFGDGENTPYACCVCDADEHSSGSQIKWKKGEPKENGIYLITTIRGIVRTAHWIIDCWLINDLPFSTLKIKAWCKLSDIEPYKEE